MKLVWKADEWERTLAALSWHRQLNNNALNQLQDTVKAYIGHIHVLEDNDRTSAVEQWVERTLDASQGTGGRMPSQGVPLRHLLCQHRSG